MPLSDLAHQTAAHDKLQRALRARRVPHAYLFTGPDGIGKESLAVNLASLLLCGDPGEVPAPADAHHGGHGRPAREAAGAPPLPGVGDVHRSIDAGAASPTWLEACGRCDDCVMVSAASHPDLHRIYRRLNKLHPDKGVRDRKAIDLGVDVIRHFLIAKVGLRPSRGRAKVFIVAEAHRLSSGAQNAMLKTLEEPPDHSYLILLASSADTLLATTRSRCQQIALRSLPTQWIIEQLRSEGRLAPKEAGFIAELSQGSPGAARQYAELGLCNQLPAVLHALQSAANDPMGCSKRLTDASKELTPAFKEQGDEGPTTNASRQAQTLILAMVSTILRDLQRIAVGSAPVVLPDEPAVSALAATTTSAAIGRTIRAVATAEYQIKRSANISLVFDKVGIELGLALRSNGA